MTDSPCKGRCRAASCRSGIHGGAVVYLTVKSIHPWGDRDICSLSTRNIIYIGVYWYCSGKSVELTAWLTVPSRTSKSLEHVQHVQSYRESGLFIGTSSATLALSALTAALAL